MNNGWVLLHRSLLDWEWYDDHNATRLLVHLILKVNWQEKKWKGIVIKAGQCATSWNTLSEETGLTVKQVRVAMHKLESSGEVARKVASKWQIVSLTKWEKMQKEALEMAGKGATKGQAEGRQRATIKESKEYKEGEEDTPARDELHPTLSQVMEKVLDLYGEDVVHSMSEFFRDSAKAFFYHYDSQGWVKGNGLPLTNWETKLKEWVEKDRREQRPRPELPKSNPAAEKAEYFKNAPIMGTKKKK